MVLKFEQILKELQQKKYRTVYLLMGEESYYIDRITDYITEHALTEEEKAFNQIILYGRDTDVATVINTAKRFPMMAKNQVVVLKEAQYLKKIEDLYYYTDQPVNSTILVINYKHAKLDKRKKVYKSILENGVILDSKKLYDYQIPQWISGYLKSKNYTIDQKAAALLTEFLGTDLSKIANELNKLFVILPTNSKITPEIIEKNIGISKEYNAFELQKALGSKNAVKAYKIVDYLGKNQKTSHINITLSLLFSYFSKLMIYNDNRQKNDTEIASKLKISPFFIKDYKQAAQYYSKNKIINVISLLREYDIKSKGIDNLSTSAAELLKELTFKILN